MKNSFLLAVLFVLASPAAFALNCPDGTEPVNNECKLIMGDKQATLEKLMEEGPNGPTAQNARAYMSKVLGNDTVAKLDTLNPKPVEDTDSYWIRLWNSMSLEQRCTAQDTGNKLAEDSGLGYAIVSGVMDWFALLLGYACE